MLCIEAALLSDNRRFTPTRVASIYAHRVTPKFSLRYPPVHTKSR